MLTEHNLMIFWHYTLKDTESTSRLKHKPNALLGMQRWLMSRTQMNHNGRFIMNEDK